jgi:hypothetical protein
MPEKIMHMDLTLFDAAAGASPGAGAAPGGGGAVGSGPQSASTDSRQGKAGDAKGLAGDKLSSTPAKPGSAAGSQTREGGAPSNTLEEKRAKFRELVQGEFKDVYTQETQTIIDRRFRQTKGLQEQLAAQQPLLEMLAQRYNVPASDVARLQQALENDRSYLSRAAEQAGMSVEAYQEVQKFRQENQRQQRALLRQQKLQQAQRQYQHWMQETQALKQRYPGFDLRSELSNPHFLGMLRAKVPMEKAYQVAHLDEIKHQAAAAREKAVTDNIRATGRRPGENIASQNSGVTYKPDVSKLTPEDRRNIVAQVRAGKEIRF